MSRSPWPFALLGVCLALALNMQPSLANPQSRSLIVLGASYARAWGSPRLPGFERVLNRGVNGEETGDMLRRFGSDVVAERPDAVLIWGLVNNISRARPDGIDAAKRAARNDYAEMLTQARAAGIAVIIATEVPWTEQPGWLNTLYGWYASLRGKTSYAVRVSAHVREVNAGLRELCRRDACRLLDFERAFANEDGTRRAEFGAEDGSHITPAGYRELSAYAARELGRGR